jgi:uncharacterized protein
MPAPGVTFERVDLNRPPVARLRTDICGFLGYAERGPLDRPVKVRTWRQFLDAFGPPLSFAHTGHAVRLFFENGGDAAYVMRVSDVDVAAVATATLDGAVTLRAAYAAIDRAGTTATGPTAELASNASSSPGAWGNRLAVTVQAGGLGAAETLPDQPADGASMRVTSIAGFEAGSYVRLVQDGQSAPFYGLIAAIEPALREIVWEQPLAHLGLDLSAPIRLETVEFSLVVTLDAQEVSRHRHLSLNPTHSRFVERILTAERAGVSAVLTVDPPLLSDPARWPAPAESLRFSGGRDGLASVTRQDFLTALAAFEQVDEISVLAAPDLVLVAEDEPAPLAPLFPDDRCQVPESAPEGRLRGRVLGSATGAPVVGVRVSSRDVLTGSALSDADGAFTATGLPIGQIGLRLEKPGFLTLDTTAQSFAVPPSTPHRFEMTPRVLPPALTEDEIFEVQAAMISQGERGLYRIALLDPPQSLLRVEALQDWRGRFDTSYAALYWPWLIVTTSEPTGRMVPPSGAVAGLVARLDRAEGPQRAPANRPLRDVQSLSHPVDDDTHALLNELGINVLRATPGRGIAPQGARTLSSDPAWRYLGVRRLLLMITEAIEEGHQWAVFEPNTQILRDALTHSLTAFLGRLWQQGALAGTSREQAFAVKCDAENNPADVVDVGRLVADIAIAPVRPYEFIRLRLGRTERLQVQVKE